MSTVKVVDVLSRAQTLLKDSTGVRWALTELQLWLNDGYRDTVILRPDANTLIGEFACVAGPRQKITTTFSNASRLIECVRNTAVSSNKSRVKLASRSSVDSMRPNWYAETQTVNIELYVFDPRTPTEFLVYPPASTAARLEVAYAQVPAAHTLTSEQLANAATSEVIRIDDMFAGALLDYVLYRAYSKDAEDNGTAGRAVAHYQAFQSALGVKGQSEAASQPGVA
jgi:hypothetical protein